MRWASLIDHPVGVHHEADRGVLAVAEDLVHRDQVAHEPLDVVEDVLAGQRDVEEGAGERARGADQPLLPRQHLLEPPAGDVGEGQQAQRLARRGAVDDDHVVVAGLVMALDLKQREELVHPRAGRSAPRRRSSSRRGRRAGCPATAGRRSSCAPSRAGPGPPGPRGARRSAVGSEPRDALEGVREAVRRVGGQHDRAESGGCAASCGCGRDARLPDPALARVEDRPGWAHGWASLEESPPATLPWP